MYTLNIGCIQGDRLTSRDSETRTFDTYEEAIENIVQSERFWKSIGYSVWFAVVTDKDGKEVYRR